MKQQMLGIGGKILPLALILLFLPLSTWFANAQVGPSVSSGSIPYRSFSGYVANGTSTTLLSGSAQPFVITTLLSNRDGTYGGLKCHLKVDAQSVLHPNAAYATTSSTFEAGNAHLVMDAGSTLSVDGYSGACYYYLEGYFAQP